MSALAAPTPTAAQQEATVQRGELRVAPRVSGTVTAGEVIRIKAPFDGRIETVLASTDQWTMGDQPLALLATRELAAMIDARSTVDQGTLLDRWHGVYSPAALRCGTDCFVLKTFVKPGQWVKSQALLFEVTPSLRLVGRVRPADAHWVADGQLIDFWSTANPQKRGQAKVSHYVIDIQGMSVDPGASFSSPLDPKHFLPPGTAWEGTINVLTKPNVIVAPTAALIRFDGSVYLPVRVSTGITTFEQTEITAGVDAGRPILIFGEGQFTGASQYIPAVDRDELEKRFVHPVRDDTPQSTASPRAHALSEPGRNLNDDSYGP